MHATFNPRTMVPETGPSSRQIPIRAKVVAGLQILLFSALVFGYLWRGRFHYYQQTWIFGTYLGVGLILLWNHIYFSDSRVRLGLSLSNLKRSLASFGPPTLLICFAFALLGWTTGETQFKASDLWKYLPWALAQQYILQNLLRLRFETLFSEPGWLSPLLASTFFGAYHWPNTPLVLLCFLGGIFWCSLYRRTPNLLSAWASQVLVMGCLLLFFKFPILNQLQVGAPGFRYEAYGDGVVVAGGYNQDSQPVVVTAPGPQAGQPSLIRVFTHSGQKLAEWLAFEQLDFSAQVSVGELGFGPGDEVAVTPGPGSDNPPIVKIFNLKGALLQEFPIETLSKGYGAWVSIQCERIFVSPGPGPNHPKTVLEFSPAGDLLNRWSFPQLPLSNGLRVSASCSPADPKLDRKLTLYLWGHSIAANHSTLYTYNTSQELLKPWTTLETDFGLNAALVRLSDQNLGWVTAPGYLDGYPAWVRVFSAIGAQVHEFASEGLYPCGSNLSSLDLDADGQDEIILGAGTCPENASQVEIRTLEGRLLESWLAY